MSEYPLSFEAAEGEVFGDILSERPVVRERIRVGLLGVAFFEYWRMFSAKFKEDVIGDLQRVADRLSQDFEVVYPCVVDTLDAADPAGRCSRNPSWICWWWWRVLIRLTTSPCRPSTRFRRCPW